MVAIDARLCRHMYIDMFRISMSILNKLFANYIGILVQDIISCDCSNVVIAETANK